MMRFSFITPLVVSLFATGCLMAATGAHARESAQSAQFTDAPVHEPVQSAASTVPVAAQPAPQPATRNASERELIRAHRNERRAIMAEGIGVSVDEINDLLSRVRPSAEERVQQRQSASGINLAGQLDEDL